jgi:hypothetical protein
MIAMSGNEHLAAFCRTLPQLRAAAARHGLAHELTAALADVRAGVPVVDVLPRLGIPADVLRSGGQDVLPGYQAVPGLTGRPTGEVHVCPWEACGRAVRRQPGGPVPDERCWVLDQPLRRA